MLHTIASLSTVLKSVGYGDMMDGAGDWLEVNDVVMSNELLYLRSDYYVGRVGPMREVTRLWHRYLT